MESVVYRKSRHIKALVLNVTGDVFVVYVLIVIVFGLITFELVHKVLKQKQICENFRPSNLENIRAQVWPKYFENRIRLYIKEVHHGEVLNNTNTTHLYKCDSIPPVLQSDTIKTYNITENNTITPTVESIWRRSKDIDLGGTWRPHDCVARHRVAIIIPYRDRWNHLMTLLNSLIPLLMQQQIHFKIYVSEQYGIDTFNKGIIMNGAYIEALAEENWDCFVFHDVDLIPENTKIMYTCPSSSPRHLSVAIDEFGYELPYEELVGGVFVVRTEHFLQLNGYSNSYWGWGAEDDDMAERVARNKFRIDRPPYNIARYKQIKHQKREPAVWKLRFGKLRLAATRMHIDGLNSLQYKLVSKVNKRLFTHIMIDVGKPPPS